MKSNYHQTHNSNSRRHCMVVHAHYPIGETRVEREAQALVSDGFEVDVICLENRERKPFEVVDGVNVHRLPVLRSNRNGVVIQLFEYLAFFVLAFLKLTTLFFERRYNSIQVHNLPDWLVFTALIPKLAGVKVILDLHDLMPEFYAARFKRPLYSLPVRLLIFQEQFSCRFADHVITVTEAWRNVLVKRGLRPSKVSVVMNVADDRIFVRPAGGEKLQSSNGHFNLLYHGNMTYRYGIDMAICAVDKLRLEIPSIHLYLHGSGDAVWDFIEMVNKMDLKEYVSFNKEALSSSELPDMILQADLCLVPYRQDVFTDGILPTKLMEYSALGMPVVAARTTAIQSYFGDVVELFTPGDADDLMQHILSLYKNPRRLAKLAQNCDKFNAAYNWTRISKEYVSLVDRLGKKQNLQG